MTKASSHSPTICVAAAAAVLALSSTPAVESFCPTSAAPAINMPGTTHSSFTATRLNLLPEQGKQLEAAMNAALGKAEAQKELCEIDYDNLEGECASPPLDFGGKQDSSSSKTTRVSRSARAFIAKMFSLPSYIRGDAADASSEIDSSSSSSFGDEWVLYPTEDKPGDDVVLFPLVGFQFVQDSPNHYSVLPSSDACNPSCRLPPQKEDLVGWYSRACHLDLYGENYCVDPLTSESSLE